LVCVLQQSHSNSFYGFFFSAEDGKFLEGEDRINYLMGKINDLRKIYMGLKNEVACIDRRRKRHRRKEREGMSAPILVVSGFHELLSLSAAQQAAIAAAQAAVDLVASQQHVALSQH
jgi:hypothetical protein